MRPLEKSEPVGFVLLDKPAGLTSFQLLFPLKRRFQTKRVGHAGTLDQEATGLMVAAVGKCTRLLDQIEAASKTYSFRLHLGRETDTLEYSGTIIQEIPNSQRTAEQLRSVIPQFVGCIAQIPPAYSAIKIEGRRASDLVREGKEIDLKARTVEIFTLDIQNAVDGVESTEFDFICHCSKGTYIRSLGRDLAVALGTVGSVSLIRRLAIGDIRVEQGQSIAEPETLALVAPEHLLLWPKLEMNDSEIAALWQGKRLRIDTTRIGGVGDLPKLFAIRKGAAVAVCRLEGGVVHPEILLEEPCA